MGWPTGAEIQQRTDIALTYDEDAGVYVTSYGLDVTQMISDAVAACAAYCHRGRYGFDEATVTETFDEHHVLQVCHPPITSVTSLTWDSVELSEADEDFYVYDRYIRVAKPSTAGLIRSEPFEPERHVAILVYVGGYSDSGDRIIPAELKAIVREMVTRELLRIDHQYREMQGVSRYDIGESSGYFSSANTTMSDLFARLARGPWEVTAVA